MTDNESGMFGQSALRVEPVPKQEPKLKSISKELNLHYFKADNWNGNASNLSECFKDLYQSI